MTSSSTNKLPLTWCACGMPLWDDTPGATVRPGHWVVCVYCGNLFELDADLKGVPKQLEDAPVFQRDLLESMQAAARILGPAMRKQHEAKRSD